MSAGEGVGFAIDPATVRAWKRYPAYKDSGVEWLGEVPAGWEIQKLKFYTCIKLSSVDKKSEENENDVMLCNYTDVYYNDRITKNLEFMKATASSEEIASFTLRQGDVLITKDSEDWKDIAVPAHVDEDLNGVLCGYHLARIRPDQKAVDSKYLFWSFKAGGINHQFQIASNGITRYGLGKYWIDNSSFLVPPLPEQHTIAAFLDRETARLDALIAKKQRFIELLEEKRQALITQAVTKGLDPDAEMKDSGVAWIGEVPAHWQLTRLGHLSTLQTGLTLGKRYDDDQPLVTRPYLRVANVQEGYFDLDTITEIRIPPENVKRYELLSGDVLMTEGGDYDKLGRGHVWEGQIPGCLHQNHIFAVRPSPSKLKPHFLAAVTTSSHGKNYFTSTSQQTTNLATTNSTKLQSLPVPVPPIPEQEEIIAFIRKQNTIIQGLIIKVRTSSEKLREYRTALISAAVTGKIDVRGEAAP